MERKPLATQRVWLLIGQLMCQVEEQAQHIEELEAELAVQTEVIAHANGAASTTEIPAAT